MIQSHAENMNMRHGEPIKFLLLHKMGLLGSQDFLHIFIMVLYYKWDVKTGFTFALQVFMLISDSLGGVMYFAPNE
jgi:hypothetical protein